MILNPEVLEQLNRNKHRRPIYKSGNLELVRRYNCLPDFLCQALNIILFDIEERQNFRCVGLFDGK